MTDITSENIFLFIGRPVKDELNSEIGKILSFIMGSTEQVSDVIIRVNSGECRCYPVDRLIVDKDSAILLSEIDKTVKIASEKIPLLWQKKKALDKLLNEDKILPELYENLHRGFIESLEELKATAKDVINELDKQTSNCEEMFKTLHLAKTYLDVEHEIGRVKEEAYKESLRAILNGLSRLVEKKQGLQIKRKTLSNILLGEESVSEGSQPEKEETKETGKVEVTEGQKDLTAGPSKSEPTITVHMK